MDYDRNISVLAARWDGETLCSLSKKYNVSRERIRQIQEIGISRLKVFAKIISSEILKKKQAFDLDDLAPFGEDVAKALAYTIKARDNVVWLGYADCFVHRGTACYCRQVLSSITLKEFGPYGKLPESFTGKRKLEDKIRRRGLEFIKYEEWKRFVIENGYVIAGRYLISAETIAQYGSLKKFEICLAVNKIAPNGIYLPQGKEKEAMKNYNELRLFLRWAFDADWVPDNDRGLYDCVFRNMILCDKGTFLPRQSVDVSSSVIEKILEYIDSSPRNTLYFWEIFEANKDALLAAGVKNNYLLKGLIQYEYPDRYSYTKAAIFKGDCKDNISTIVFQYMEENGLREIDYDGLRDAFPGIPAYVFQDLYKNEKFEKAELGRFRLKEVE